MLWPSRLNLMYSDTVVPQAEILPALISGVNNRNFASLAPVQPRDRASTPKISKVA